MSTKQLAPRRGWSTSDEQKPERRRVPVPASLFESLAEREIFERAMRDNPRKTGEDMADWMDRITAAAVGRQPGEEG